MRVLAGAVSGLAATLALAGLASLERRVRGGPAVYDPALMAARLSGRWLGVRLGTADRRRAGGLGRWPYGASWGVALALLRPSTPWPVTGLGLGASIWAFEVLALPLVGATPPLSRWGAREVAGDLLNTAVYGLVAAGAEAGLRRR